MNVYITNTSCYLPNVEIGNDEIEDVLGEVYNKASHIKKLVLKRNGIRTRYYALDNNRQITHSNAELATNAIREMSSSEFSIDDIDFLACGTSSSDFIFPSQASMVHGLLGGKPMELFSQSGVCLSSLQALKAAYWAIFTGERQTAVCVNSEQASPVLTSSNFELEQEISFGLNQNPYMAFEKEFLRFMLSDGASAALLKNKPSSQKTSYKIEWIDMVSYANELPTCMLCGGEKINDEKCIGWKYFTPKERAEKSIFTIKQDVRLLQKYAIPYFAKSIEYFVNKHNAKKIDYVLPHISSMFFFDKLKNELNKNNISIGEKGWYTNLSQTGNIGAAAILAILHGFRQEKKYKKGETILLLVPESGRFSYGAALLTIF